MRTGMDEAPDEHQPRRVVVGRWTPQGWQINADPSFAQPEHASAIFCNHYCRKHGSVCGKFAGHGGTHDCGC